MPFAEIESAEVSFAPPRWKTLHFNVKNFKDLPTTRDHFVATPFFSCNGHWWVLWIYPGGRNGADEGYVSIDLHHRSEGSIAANYELMLIDKFGKAKNLFRFTNNFEGLRGYGWANIIKRSDILKKSQNILDSNGTLTVGVSIEEEPSTVFVPKNPILKTIQGMFLDVDTADVCFEVICSAEKKEGEKKKAKASQTFHAHHLILKTGAPMLADLFDLDDSDGKLATAAITDIKPDIFRRLLCYIYGGTVSKEDLESHAKDIIDAADKYSIVNLKLEAEAAYVKSIDITMENAMDNLLYADAKNCALLKEAVMNFLAENGTEAYEKISFDNVPGYLMKDLILAFSNNSKKDASGTTTDELTSLSVSALRRKLAEKGLDIDGSREAMIESIKNHS